MPESSIRGLGTWKKRTQCMRTVYVGLAYRRPKLQSPQPTHNPKVQKDMKAKAHELHVSILEPLPHNRVALKGLAT